MPAFPDNVEGSLHPGIHLPGGGVKIRFSPAEKHDNDLLHAERSSTDTRRRSVSSRSSIRKMWYWPAACRIQPWGHLNWQRSVLPVPSSRSSIITNLRYLFTDLGTWLDVLYVSSSLLSMNDNYRYWSSFAEWSSRKKCEWGIRKEKSLRLKDWLH